MSLPNIFSFQMPFCLIDNNNYLLIIILLYFFFLLNIDKANLFKVVRFKNFKALLHNMPVDH